ncbi:hypothetical protein LPA44_13925 [Halobacterium sp. KA-4]|uniref:hypothetical protein n=1 Tax=Halobacterium sp. KA-4 TaxID=2896367 RepID=UPI001E4AD1A9|nr:hypothetical protein [Halobacterium sp. KA-4]MCD2200984.1 hypothetical protein [Halobacterium sp. KA-4]
MDWITVGLTFLFFWGLLGQYVYREAMKENRSSPILRGVCWGAIGVLGAVTYLIHLRDKEADRLAWLGVSLLLVTVWAIGTVGLWGLSGGFHLWAALFAGVFILYWQFNLETVAPGRVTDSE